VSDKEQCSFPNCACLKWCAVKIGKRVPDRQGPDQRPLGFKHSHRGEVLPMVTRQERVVTNLAQSR
jgi:hypothetical protein